MTAKLKIAAVSGIALASLALLWTFSEPPSSVPPAPAPNAPPPAQAEAEERGAAQSVEEGAQREIVTPTQPAAATTGSLLVRVVHGVDQSPAAAVGLVLRYPDGRGFQSVDNQRTDGAGTARFGGLCPGRVYLELTRNLMEGHYAEITAGEQTELDVELPVGVDIRGIVVNSDDVPVAGAQVEINHIGRDGLADPVTTTDAGGRFTLRSVIRVCRIGARAEGYAPSLLQDVSGSVGGSVEVKVVLPGHGGAIEGRVIGPDGTAVAGARVLAGTDEDKSVKRLDGSYAKTPCPVDLRTDPDGGFRAFGLPEGSHPVSVRAPGFALWQGACEVVAYGSTSLLVQLRQGVTCVGTLRDAAGGPAVGVEIHSGRWGRIGHYSAETAADGSFRIAGLPAGEIELRADDEKLGKATIVLQGVDGETLRWDGQLSRGLELRGRVLTEGGDPMDEVFVEVVARGDGQKAWGGIGKTDGEGRFAVGNCPSGRSLTVDAGKRGFARAHLDDVDPRAGEVVLRLRAVAEPTVRIVGRVIDPDGRPLPNANVMAVSRTGGAPNRMTESGTGAFELGPMRPGKYTLRVRMAGYPMFRSSERVLVDGETWDAGALQLERGGRVEVLLRSDTAPLPKVDLWIYDADAQGHGRIDETDGKRLSGLLGSGDYFLSVTGPEVAAQWVPFAIDTAVTTELQVTVTRGVMRGFACTAPRTDNLVEGVQPIRVTITGERGIVQDRFRAQRGAGPARFQCALAPGRYTVTARNEGGHTSRVEFTVPPDGDAEEIELTLR